MGPVAAVAALVEVGVTDGGRTVGVGRAIGCVATTADACGVVCACALSDAHDASSAAEKSTRSRMIDVPRDEWWRHRGLPHILPAKLGLPANSVHPGASVPALPENAGVLPWRMFSMPVALAVPVYA